MAIIAEFSIPTESFALAETFEKFPDRTVEADRIVAHSTGMTMPCIWVADDDSPGFKEAIAADPTVEKIQATASFHRERLYHVEWSDSIKQIIQDMIDHEGVILEAFGESETWVLRIRFMTREQFEAFQEHFADRSPGIQLVQLFTPEYARHTRGSVTTEQYEALTTAVELGYYAVPNKSSIEEVANELEITHQAVSERLRRGIENMVRDMLDVEPIHGNG